MNRIDTPQDVEIFDVLIVGAGISGVGAAHYLQADCPAKSFVILETKEKYGGTWETHKYPGIRSDSDLYTFGYKFKPWMGKPVAEADAILEYMGEVIEEEGIAKHIRYGHTVKAASWSSTEQVWRVSAVMGPDQTPVTYLARFLWMCQGYYDHSKGYMPEYPGRDSFKGQVLHPQEWPEDFDYTGKKVVVIGSGATAATMIPNMADKAAHVTMLQRSPTYFWTAPNRNMLADILGALRFPKSWIHAIVRWQILFMGKLVQNISEKNPEKIKRNLFKGMHKHLGDDFDYEKHFTPSYRPWQQRLAYVPDGDLFKAIKSGKVTVVTDHIDSFTQNGIQTKETGHLDADIIVSATGFNMLFLGGIAFDIDGKSVDVPKSVAYRGLMLSGLPNLTYMFGYLRTSWTMRVDLVASYIVRLLNHMDKKGATVVTPTLRDSDADMDHLPAIKDDDFNAGYVKRGLHLFPRQGDREPWMIDTSYYNERDVLPKAELDDGVLLYDQPTPTSTNTKTGKLDASTTV